MNLSPVLFDSFLVPCRVLLTASTVNGIVATEKCYVRKSGLKYHVDLHAIVNAEITVRQGHEIAHRLADKLKYELPQIMDVLVHIEPHE